MTRKKTKEEILKATKEKSWSRYRSFNVYHSLRGLPERIVVYPKAFGYPPNMNPMAFAKFPIRRNYPNDIECALRFFSKFC